MPAEHQDHGGHGRDDGTAEASGLISVLSVTEFLEDPEIAVPVICLDPDGSVRQAVGHIRAKTVLPSRRPIDPHLQRPASRVIGAGHGFDFFGIIREWAEFDAEVFSHIATLLLRGGGLANYDPRLEVAWDVQSLVTALLVDCNTARTADRFEAIARMSVLGETNFIAACEEIAARHGSGSVAHLWMTGWRCEDSGILREVRSVVRQAFAWAAWPKHRALLESDPSGAPDILGHVDTWLELPRPDIAQNAPLTRLVIGTIAYLAMRMGRPRVVVVPDVAVARWSLLFGAIGIMAEVAPESEDQKKKEPPRDGLGRAAARAMNLHDAVED